VLEDGEGEGELVAVEGALRLADDHRLEAAAGVAQQGEQLVGLGRRGQGSARVWSMSKNSATITPPLGSMSCRARTPASHVKRRRPGGECCRLVHRTRTQSSLTSPAGGRYVGGMNRHWPRRRSRPLSGAALSVPPCGDAAECRRRWDAAHGGGRRCSHRPSGHTARLPDPSLWGRVARSAVPLAKCHARAGRPAGRRRQRHELGGASAAAR
jgi:hypothetical protein